MPVLENGETTEKRGGNTKNSGGILLWAPLLAAPRPSCKHRACAVRWHRHRRAISAGRGLLALPSTTTSLGIGEFYL